MYQQDGHWYSEFPPVRGVPTLVQDNNSVVAVTSYHGLTGGHSAMYLETIDATGDAVVFKIHLTAGLGGSQNLESTGSGSSASGSGTNEIDINVEPKEVNTESRDRSQNLHYQSWAITNVQYNALVQAVDRFKAKVGRGRYTYRLAGGVAGWLSTMPGTRGVNCADFCIKVLKEANIANISNKLINTPKRVAGH
jgi:hypothetical protein